MGHSKKITTHFTSSAMCQHSRRLDARGSTSAEVDSGAASYSMRRGRGKPQHSPAGTEDDEISIRLPVELDLENNTPCGNL